MMQQHEGLNVDHESLNLNQAPQVGLLTPHFALSEFTESATARKHGIPNIPPPEAVQRLKKLCCCTLEPLREELGMPIIILSGFRCKPLNDILSHASHKSQHLVGSAADFYVGRPSPADARDTVGSSELTARERLIKAFRLILTSSRIDYDQLILYPSFIHVSYVSPEANRHHILTANGKGQYRRVTGEG